MWGTARMDLSENRHSSAAGCGAALTSPHSCKEWKIPWRNLGWDWHWEISLLGEFMWFQSFEIKALRSKLLSQSDLQGLFSPPSVSFNCCIDTNLQKFDSTVVVNRQEALYVFLYVSERYKIQQKNHLIKYYLWEKFSEVQGDILLGQK